MKETPSLLQDHLSSLSQDHRQERFFETHPILVCMGSGGVGKTTISATLALQGALRGKKVLALTIDPAKRLADALGLPAIKSIPTPVPLEKLSLFSQELGIPLPTQATVDVLMVDQKSAFDELIFQYAPNPSHARRILHNPIYQQMSTSLAGVHEYAALATLYQFHHQNKYDLIVLDTPPTIHAVDFLDSPFQLGTLFNSSALYWFMKPYLSGSHWAGLGGALVMKGLARFVGSSFLEQIGKFLYEFQPILLEFQKRANALSSLLQSDKVCFLLICSPHPNSIEEATYLAGKLKERHFSLGGVIINRVLKKLLPTVSVEETIDFLSIHPLFQNFTKEEVTSCAQKLLRTYQEQQLLAEHQGQAIQNIKKQIFTPFCQIPALSQNIHGISSLVQICKSLEFST